MKLTIERGALLKSLGHVQSVVERRTTIPILSNVKLEAAEGQLKLTATDLDISVVDSAAAEVDQEGAATVPAHTFYDIVRKLPEGAQVVLSREVDGGRLSLTAGRARFVLACLPEQDFPALSEGDLSHRFTLAAEALRQLIDRTRFAISTEETRYYLNGVYFHVAETKDGPKLRAVATDGHRLAQVEFDLPEGAGDMPGVIIPRKTVNELRKLLDEIDGDVEISLSDTKIRFDLQTGVLTSKLIDGTFPDYNRVIPAHNDKLLEVNSRDFAAAVDRVSTISTDRTKAVKLILEENRLTLSVVSPDFGVADEELSVRYGGDPLEIGFNARYLMDILAQNEGEMAQVELADAASPTIVRDADDTHALYVLMPMRV